MGRSCLASLLVPGLVFLKNSFTSDIKIVYCISWAAIKSDSILPYFLQNTVMHINPALW